MARHPRSDSTDGDAGFVSRWSRRKQQARERERSTDEVEDREEPSRSEEAIADAQPQLPEKTDDDMPPIESITDTSNVADFLSPRVSEQLRKMALRKLFHGAKFNIRDGLDDYDEDFRDFATLGEIITSDMKHQQELALEREQEALLQNEAESSSDDEAKPERTTVQANDAHTSDDDNNEVSLENAETEKHEEGSGA